MAGWWSLSQQQFDTSGKCVNNTLSSFVDELTHKMVIHLKIKDQFEPELVSKATMDTICIYHFLFQKHTYGTLEMLSVKKSKTRRSTSNNISWNFFECFPSVWETWGYERQSNYFKNDIQTPWWECHRAAVCIWRCSFWQFWLHQCPLKNHLAAL